MFYKQSGNMPPNDGTYRSKLRNSNLYVIPRPYLTFYKKTFMYLAPKIYNALPESVKMEKSINGFKNKIKEWLFLQNDIEDMFKAE